MKRLVKAWDPDYTKLTVKEAKKLKKAMNEEFIPGGDMNRDNSGDA